MPGSDNSNLALTVTVISLIVATVAAAATIVQTVALIQLPQIKNIVC
jgi:hypothetical protein